mgnify:CR=1
MANVTTTPNDLAEKLFGKTEREKRGKQVRAFLRATFPRSVKNVTWVLTDEQVATVTAWANARKNGKPFDASAFIKARRARSRKPKVTAEPSGD